MRYAKLFACVAAAGTLLAASLSGCAGKSTLLAAADAPRQYEVSSEGEAALDKVISAANAFSARLTEAVVSDGESNKNFAISPVSVFFALATVVPCAEGETKEELLALLGLTQDELEAGLGRLYSHLNATYENGKITTANSVWLGKGYEFDPDCVDRLASEYFCSSYAADFADDNRNANLAVRDYIRRMTEGLLDIPLELSEDVVFTLINTVYLADNWNHGGDPLPLADGMYDFERANGESVATKLMRGDYNPGRAREGENYTAFYTRTHDGYDLHFILPDEGTSLSEALTSQAILQAAEEEYFAVDDVNMIQYMTRALFPAFTASYDGDMRGLLGEMGLKSLFSAELCDLTAMLPGGEAWCGAVRHAVKLKVDRKGLEGAAFTYVAMAGSAGPMYEEVKADFVVDRAFGYVVTSPRGAILFSGIVDDIDKL